MILKTGWLATKRSELEERIKKHLRMLLGREEPDRDFKRGLSARSSNFTSSELARNRCLRDSLWMENGLNAVVGPSI